MKKVDLTEGKVILLITSLALSIMGSSFLQFTYNIIDMIWVGRLGSEAVASVGSSSLYVNIGYALNSLVVIGTGIRTAHAIGKKDDNEVQRYINSGIVINTIMGIVFGLVLIFGGKAFISFLNLDNIKVEKDAYVYLALNAPILFFNFFNLMYTRILLSFGNNKLTFRINGAGVLINIILDPIFIYVLKFGVMGAALSTLIANIIMFILFRVNCNEILSYKFKIPVDYKDIKEIIHLGSPMAFQRILFTVINIILAKIIASFGADAIAAQKIGVQIESIVYMVTGGFNGAVASFTGQNFGGRKYERIRKGYNSALIIGMVYAFIISILFLFLNKPILKLFIDDINTSIIAASYLKAVAFSQIFNAIEMTSTGLLTGIGKPSIPASISIVFTVLRIPLSLILIKPFGINGIWITISLTSIMKGIVSYVLVKGKLRNLNNYSAAYYN